VEIFALALTEGFTLYTAALRTVGMLDPKVFSMRAKDGQMQVMQTATRRPPFQPRSDQHAAAATVGTTLTLHSIPYEV
jgi:hypothetical protein